MSINFFEPGDIPQPKDQVKIERLSVLIAPDRWRVRVNIDVTPFQQRPNLAVVLMHDLPEGATPAVVADMTIIETMHNKMEFTMHIRGQDDPAGDYVLKTRLYYEQDVHAPHDEAAEPFTIPRLEDMPAPNPEDIS